MNRSDSITELATALIKFNSKVTSISKDGLNPQFRSEYVTLDHLIKETRPLLQEVGLSIMQFPLTKETGEIGIQTMLIHESGQFLESEPLFMTPMRMVKGGAYEVARDPQAAGSVISYLRRYSYQAILNLNTGEDDDGNKSSIHSENQNNNYNNSYSINSNGNLTDKQVARIFGIAKGKNINQDTVVRMIASYGVTDAKFLTKEQYDDLCTKLENGELPVTTEQLDSIKTLMKANNIDKASMQKIVKDIIGVSKAASSLTNNEAVEVINHLLSIGKIA